MKQIPQKTPQLAVNSSKIPIRLVDIKNWGLKSAKDKSFSLPPKKKKSQNQFKEKSSGQLSLNKLKVQSDVKDIERKKITEIKKIEKGEEKKKKSNQKMKLFSYQNSKKQFSDSRKNFINDNSKELNSVFDISDIDVQFTPPKGYKFDELNQMEQVLFSFQKRIFEKYLNSFLSSLSNQKKHDPSLLYEFKGRNELLVGRIIFDKEGNTQRINMLKWSDSYKVQNLFEETLKGIRSLPNPPKMIAEEENFEIFFKLRFGDPKST